MLDLYSILQCEFDAPFEELKRNYRRLILVYHPDKTQEDDKTSEQKKDLFYHRIDQAWSILRDTESRAEYNALWTQYKLAQDWPIQETVHFIEFDKYESESSEFEYICRCGGKFILDQLQRDLGVDIVCCDTCSLSIKVCYTNE